jgi:hypothetical protein
MCVLLLLFHSALEMQEGGGNVGGREGKRGDGGRRGREREGSKDCRRRTGGGYMFESRKALPRGGSCYPGGKEWGEKGLQYSKVLRKDECGSLERERGKDWKGDNGGGGSLYSAGLILRGGESFSSLNSPTRESLSPSAELKACERASERDNNKHTHTETR